MKNYPFFEVQFRTWDVITVVVQAEDADEAQKLAEQDILDGMLRPNEEYETLDILELKQDMRNYDELEER